MTDVSAIPATPVAGTADTNELLTFAKYQFITQDTASSSANFDMALDDALDMLQREMHRTFLYAQYVERLYVYRNGQVYPSATPLDSSKPTGTSSDPDGTISSYVIQGAGIYVGFLNPLPSLPIFSWMIPMQTDVSYWGGYTQTTIPAKLARIIARTCWFILNPAHLEGQPGGVKSVSVGGVSMSGDLSSFMANDRQLRLDIARFTRRSARSWQA
ncbi:MAG: hypothetical protein JWO62_2634 [Acidimicrobiaceae bacterium]|nr:hypothetical protein [Acidimicrobiaceae bacterium]